MLRFKTFQRLYDGDYVELCEMYGVKNESEMLLETAMSSVELGKYMEVAINVTQNNTWKIENKSTLKNKHHNGTKGDEIILTDDGQEFLLDALVDMRDTSDSEWQGKFDGHFARKYPIEATVADEKVMLKFADLSKTQTFKENKMSAADKTARQESLAALALMLADDLASNKIQEIPELPALLKDVRNYGSPNVDSGKFEVNINALEAFKKFFWIRKYRTENPEKYFGGKTFKDLMEFLYHNDEWLDVTIKTAEGAISTDRLSDSIGSEDQYEVHRGTEFMNLIYDVYQYVAMHSSSGKTGTGIAKEVKKNDKWNPGDVWMVKASVKDTLKDILTAIKKTDSDESLSEIVANAKKVNKELADPKAKEFVGGALHYYNWLIQKWYDDGLLKGVSLKKFDTANFDVYNEDPKEDAEMIDVEFAKFGGNSNDPLKTKDVYIYFNVVDKRIDDDPHTYRMQLRSFDNKVVAIQGEIKGEKANHGKIGVGVIRYMMGIEKGDKLFREWRKSMEKIYQDGYQQYPRLTPHLTDVRGKKITKRGLVSYSSKGVKDLTTDKKIPEEMRKLLVRRILLLNKYIFPNSTATNQYFKKITYEDIPDDRLASKIQALEICAWVKHLIGTFGDEEDRIMKRLYFYASSRGNIETGAFSSKFLKIG